MLIHILIGIIVGSGVSLIFMLICAFILTASDFDASVATPMSNICLALGAAVGGFVSAIAHRSRGLVVGAAVGFTMFILVTIVSLIVSGSEMSINTPLRLVIMTLIAAVGGIIGVNRTAKRKLI